MISSITDRHTFTALRTNARLFRSGPVSARFLDDRAQPPRLAFAIGRHYGNAVARNRARRRVAALFREAVMNNPDMSGTFLVSVRRELKSCSFGELQTAVSDLISDCLNP